MIPREVEQQYGIKVTKWRPVKDVLRINVTEGRSYCLKSFNGPESTVQFIVQVIHHLRNSGFQRTPKIFNTREGADYIKSQGKFYMLTDWIDGSSPDFKNRNELKKGVKTLAAFHHHAKHLSISNVPASRHRVFSLEQQINSYQTLLREHNSKGKLDSCIDLCNKAIAALQTKNAQAALVKEDKKHAFAHGDYNYPNLVRDKEGALNIVDFDNASLHARMTDLAHLLHRNTPWRGQKTLKLIDLYIRDRNLEYTDRHLLFALLLVPYPIVRFLYQYPNRWRNLKTPVPTSAEIRHYVKALSKLTER